MKSITVHILKKKSLSLESSQIPLTWVISLKLVTKFHINKKWQVTLTSLSRNSQTLCHEEHVGERAITSPFLVLVLGGGELSASRPGFFSHREGSHWVRGYVGPRARTDALQKEKIIIALAGNRAQTFQPVAIPTELFRIQSEYITILFCILPYRI
jgi:hypothetical protein